ESETASSLGTLLTAATSSSDSSDTSSSSSVQSASDIVDTIQQSSTVSSLSTETDDSDDSESSDSSIVLSSLTEEQLKKLVSEGTITKAEMEAELKRREDANSQEELSKQKLTAYQMQGVAEYQKQAQYAVTSVSNAYESTLTA
ncbi:MAG: hypothetical protein N2Z57_03545, partial [Oscillospiraceae bacterium]|nr:hypothetical protein [Oscillospiraceae bacterium]